MPRDYEIGTDVSRIAGFLLVISFNIVTMNSPTIKKVFFIVGPPGSGKTTIAEMIKNNNSDRIVHYSVGSLLRAESKEDTERGHLIKNIIDNGQIVPLEIGMDVVNRAIQESSKKIILLDGFPPTFEYAIEFEKLTKRDSSIKLIGAIEIFVNEDVAVERVLKRSRSDDDCLIFAMRYKRYNQNAVQLNEWYKKNYRFHSINGCKTLNESIHSVEAHLLSDI